MGAYQAKSAASYLASLVNLANPGTNDLAEVGGGSVNWGAGTGWSGFAALARCLDTGIVPTLNQTWSVLVQYTGAGNASTNIIGLLDSVGHNGRFIILDRVGDVRVFNGSGAAVSTNAPASPAAANYGFAGLQPYRNAAAEGAMIVAGVGATDLSIYIGARNTNGLLTVPFDGAVESIALYSVTLTAPQVLARETAQAAL